MKSCKVVTTYFGARRKYPRNFEESKDLLSKMIEKEKGTDAGVNCDVIIVNHLCEKNNDRAIELLDSVNGTEIKNGKIITMNRPYDNGEGFGFKSRDYAFQKYQNDYDYWFFVEDDLNCFLDGYYRKCIDILEQKPHVAFVCTFHDAVAGSYPFDQPRYRDKHCHGSIGCTHVRFLKEIGTIPYPKSDDYDAAQDSEIEGTNIFIKKGYSLARVGECIHDKAWWAQSDLGWESYEQDHTAKHPYTEYHPKKGYI